MKRKRAAVGFLGLLLLIGVGLITARVLVLYAARGVLEHWSDAGLPGEAPRGDGPFVDMRWPPHISWSNLRWGEGDLLRLSCSKLEVGIDPLTLLRGRLRLREVEVENLKISGTKSIIPWSDLLIQSLNDLGTPGVLDRGVGAVRFDIAPITFDSSSVQLSRLEGWAWTPHHAGWAFVTRAARDGLAGSMVVRGSGSGSAGSGELTIDVDMGENRLLHMSARRLSASEWAWQVSGRDDGTIVSTLLLRRTHLFFPAHGLVDFSVSREPPGAVEGEAELRDLKFERPSVRGDPVLTMNGRLCLSGGILSLQEIDVKGADLRLRVDADVPLIPGGSSSCRCLVDGRWNGSNVRFDGAIRRIEDGISLFAPHIDLLGMRTGPANLGWVVSGRADSVSHLKGEVMLGSGAITIRGGIGTARDPLLLRARAIPISVLEPLLPIPASGDWSGELDGQATVTYAPDGWSGGGTASLIDGQVRGVPLLAEIGSLWGERGGSGIRFERVSTRWSYGLGCFLADSLTARLRSLQIEGSVVYALPDSVLGILQISPGSGAEAGSILRLLGGDSAVLDIGISGSARSPGIVLLDPLARAQWRERIETFRRAASKS